MYCPNCQTGNLNSDLFCRECGANLKSTAQDDAEGVGPVGIVFFCFPVVGVILHFFWKDEKPIKSKQACNLALMGVGASFILTVIYYAIILVLSVQ